MRIHLTSIFLLVSCALFAQQPQFTFQGVVTDATTDEAIVGATIYMVDLKKGAITNTDGKFSIDRLPRGKFLVEIKYIGYSSLVQRIEIQEDLVLNFALTTTITELNEIVISGVSHSTELKKNPVSVVTLSAEALRQNSATNIIDNISQKAGVSQLNTGVAISKPIIRGVGHNRVITLYDGIRQEGQQWGDEHGIEIDEYAVDRVEIIKGAGSLMYGSDGIGGVLNLLAPNPVHEGKIEAEWVSNFQTNNSMIANSVMIAGNQKGKYWSVRATQKSAKPYQNEYDGRVFNSGFNEKDINFIAGINKAWGYSQFNVSSFNQNIGLVEGTRDAEGHFTKLVNIGGTEDEETATSEDLNTYHLFIPRQTVNHRRVSNNTNVFFGNARLQGNLAYQQNLRKEYGNILDEGEEELFFDLKTFNYSLIAFLPERKGWNLSLGVMGMSQQNSNRGEEFLIPEYSVSDFGAVSFVKKNFDKLDVGAGIRIDNRSLSNEALYLDSEGKPGNSTGELKFASNDFSFSNYSASAGFTYLFSERFSMKANASRGFRAPTISELTSNGRHEGSLRYEYGNENLKAETNVQGDLSILLNSTHVSADLALFQNSINNYIYVEKLLASDGTDSIPDPTEPVPAYQYVQGKARLTGGEFSIDIHPHPLDWLHVENSLSVVFAENLLRDSEAKYLPFIPAPRFQSELRATAKSWKSFSNMFFKIQLQVFGKQNRVLLENRTETATPSYSLINAGFGLDFHNKKKSTFATLTFMVQNLLDKSYQNHLSRLKYADENPATGRPGVFNPGRNASVKLIVPLTIYRGEK
jgi:iron complex outermembrane recepter protein